MKINQVVTATVLLAPSPALCLQSRTHLGAKRHASPMRMPEPLSSATGTDVLKERSWAPWESKAGRSSSGAGSAAEIDSILSTLDQAKKDAGEARAELEEVIKMMENMTKENLNKKGATAAVAAPAVSASMVTAHAVTAPAVTVIAPTVKAKSGRVWTL